MLGLLGLIALVATAGCHRRAYNDLYLENMAAEIRDLEDQLYEYDHEYQLLEEELQLLRQQNERLKHASMAESQPEPPAKHNPLQFQPRSGMPVIPEPTLPPYEYDPQSILEGDNSGGATTRPLFPSDELPSPKLDSPPSTMPPGAAPNSGAPPRLPESNSPSLQLPQLNPGSPNQSPAAPSFPRSSPRPRTGDGFLDDIDAEELMPPPIDPGEPMPPPMAATSNNGSLPPDGNLEMNLSRIEVPGRLASQTSTDNQGALRLATEKVTDTRVIELGFHPSLCRAIDLDDRSDDDGLYLVLQPKNEKGQFVPVAAELSIAVLDPNREGAKAHIGRWDYSMEDVKAKLKPIGVQQGFHFTLPWNGPDPSADRVIVFALYKFDNGRQVIGEKEIFVSSDGSFKSVFWVPRASESESGNPVATASGSVPKSTSKNVVRPASASFMEPAPQPGRQ